MRISPFAKNVNRIERHLKDLDLYLTAKAQTGTIDHNDVESLLRFLDIVGSNFDFNCKLESWWTNGLYEAITKDVSDMVKSLDGQTTITEERLQDKIAYTESMIESMDDDIAIELKAAIKESIPSLLVLFPPEKIAL